MPGFDRTGPRGEGPRTGWAMGKCVPGRKTSRDTEIPEQDLPGRGPGTGLGRGPGTGLGRGPGTGLGRGPGIGLGRGFGRGPGRGRYGWRGGSR